MLKSKNHDFLVQKTKGFLKADFHIHTKEDPYDKHLISYSAKDLINYAAKQGFEVLSITNHESVYFNKSIYDYARKKGIFLIPGAEAKIEGKHVVLINITNADLKKIKTFEDLKKLKKSALIIAPHPFFIKKSCLGKKLEKYIDYFDAIEYSHYYMKLFQNPLLRFFDRNHPAMQIAKKYKKPLVGTSDMHYFYQMNHTFSMIDSKKNKDEVIKAIKKGKIKLVTKPLSFFVFLKRTLNLVVQ